MEKQAIYDEISSLLTEYETDEKKKILIGAEFFTKCWCQYKVTGKILLQQKQIQMKKTGNKRDVGAVKNPYDNEKYRI